MRAARSSAAVYEWGLEAEHWLRALDLWPPGWRAWVTRRDPPSVYLAACDALRESLQSNRAAAMSDAAEAELGEVDDSIRAELLIRAAEYRGDREGFGIGLELIDQALALYAELPATAGHLRALNYKRLLLTGLGQLEDATMLARTAVEAASAVGDPRLLRHQLSSLAWCEGMEARLTTMTELVERGRALLPPGTDPVGDIRRRP